MPFVMEGFSFGILRLLDHLNVNLVLGLVEIARVCEVDWSALSDQSWIPY